QQIAPGRLLLANWLLLLSRVTGESEPSIGVRCDGRSYEELDQALGPYSRSMPLQTNCQAELSFATYASEVARAYTQAAEEQHYFVWETENVPQTRRFFPLQFEDVVWPASFSLSPTLSASLLSASCCSEPFALKLSALLLPSRCLLDLSFDARLFSAEQVQRLASTFSTLLRQTLLRPHAPLHSCPLLLPQDAPTLRGPALSLPTLPLHTHIDAIARQYPT